MAAEFAACMRAATIPLRAALRRRAANGKLGEPVDLRETS